MRVKHLTRTKQIVSLIIVYGYYSYFTTDTLHSSSRENKSKNIEHLQDITLPPNLQNDELFNLAKPTDSSGREIFADKGKQTIYINGKSANYSALKDHQLNRALSCNASQFSTGPGNEKPKCSASFFREYYSKCDYFLYTGRWKKWKSGYPAAYFQPNVCDMPSQKNTNEYMVKTIGKWNAKNILVLGDSNAHRFYLTLLQSLTNYTGLDYECSLIKMEKPGKLADVSYFTNGTTFKANQILIKSRTCSTCNSEMNKCVLPPSSKFYGQLPSEIVLEYLSMTLVTLDGITLKGSGKHETMTQQEFLIKHYLKDRYPEILFIGATFTHDKRKPFDFVQKCMEHFIGLVDRHIPRSTRVMWLNAAAHNNIPYNNCGIGFNLRIFDMEYELKGNEKLEMLNHLMFYLLKEKLMDRSSNHFAMLDLYALSNKVMKGWARDCVHFLPSWYQTLTAYMFAILASSEG